MTQQSFLLMYEKNIHDNLHSAKRAKKDEFYTQISVIEKELFHYRQYFEDKVIFLNCDDPESSNFWKYFELNFDSFGLKRLIATHYDEDKPSYKLELINDGAHKIVKTPLLENGDFRSDECLEILKESDIVVTNPPFSLFREYVSTLMLYEKKFIILGNNNAITYKEIFPLIKNNELWLGMRSNFTCEFEVGEGYRYDREENGKKYGKVSAISWFTNLDIRKRHDLLILFETYSEEKYPKYTNCDAINVDEVTKIPKDYDGLIGVPISFLSVYNPEQFEIVKFRKGDDGKDLMLSDRQPYFRILIKRKK